MQLERRGIRPAGVDTPDLRVFVFALFFVFGGITSLNDVIIPKLKEIFVLSYAEAMLVQSAFFMAYFVFSIPAARVVLRVGYMRTAALGLITMCGRLARGRGRDNDRRRAGRPRAVHRTCR